MVRPLTRELLKTVLPFLRRGGALRRSLRALGLRNREAKEIFTAYYGKNYWNDCESVSGPGSNMTNTRRLREALPGLLEDLQVRELLDAACGDFFWMKEVELGSVRYTGCDIVEELVSDNQRRYGSDTVGFFVRDLLVDSLPRADLVLCRDCMIHLSNLDARRALENIRRSGSRYLLATTFPAVERNRETVTGGRRSVNLELPPFDLPPPLRLIPEDDPMKRGRALGLWEISTAECSRLPDDGQH
jgi:SAM-dependent methyltransferase